jgi:hypothetical protein
MRFYEIIEEGVNDQFLYHGVGDGKTVMAILKSGFIRPDEAFDFDIDQDIAQGKTPKDRISLSRSQYLRFPYGKAVAQFVVDKNALRKHGYKVEPVVGAMIQHKGETEEQVYKNIPVKAPFVVAIQYDPDLKIPKGFFDHAKASGVRIEPWKKEGTRYSKSDEPTGPKPATKYTDPDKLKLTSHKFLGNTVWDIMYDMGDGSSKVIHPYYLNKDGDATTKAYTAIKDRIAKGLSFDDLLPQSQYKKDWKRGEYEIRPDDPEYKKS